MNDYTEIGGLSYANSKTGQNKKEWTDGKRFDCHGRFRCAIDGLLYDRGRIICCHSDSYFLFLHRSRFASGASIFTSSCKSAKRWGLTIIGVIISLLSLIMGMHWGMCVGGLIGAFLADMIAGTKNYRSKKLNILAYIVYSFGPMGTYIAYFVDPEGWASTMLQNGTTQEYINAMNNAAAWWVLVIMIVGTALIAWLSGLVGCKLLRKQFEKAGITA